MGRIKTNAGATRANACVCRHATLARVARFLVGASVIFSTLLIAHATDSPENLLAAGRVDQAFEIIEQQIRVSPAAESYNLLCRAHFEVGAWDAGIPACEKAIALAPSN